MPASNCKITVIAALFAGSLAYAQPYPAPPRPQVIATGPKIFEVDGGGKIRVTPVAMGLFHPWSLTFADARTILVTERNGQLRMIRDGMLVPEPVWTSPTPAGTAMDALHFVTVHPKFAENQMVYLSYPKKQGDLTTLAIARGKLSAAKLSDVKEIFVADAWETSGNLAGRLYFGPDSMLYVTVGDRDRLCCTGSEDNSLRMKSQSLGSHVGKTLRLKDDGTAPADNPFVARKDAKPEIFTYGNRNPYGLAVNPETGELWEAEIGPMGGDEVNILSAGHNYGWPLVSMGRNYTGTLVSEQPWARPGMDNPRMFWVPSISPSSILFYTGDQFPQWKNHMFIGSLSQRSLIRVSFHQPSQAEKRESLLLPLEERVRDVQQGPDGYLYVATERGSNGTIPDGTVLRIEPAQ